MVQECESVWAENKWAKRVAIYSILSNAQRTPMSIRYRNARPKDIHEYVEILAGHPTLGPRYGRTLSEFPKAMLSLLGQDSFQYAIFEELNGGSARLLGGAVGSFVREEFLRELKTPPSFWGPPEIVRRINQGESPVLSNREVREANSRDGLNLFVWHVGIHPEDHDRPEVASRILTAFVETYRGFRIRELLEQAETWWQFRGMRAAGGCFVRPSDGSYADYFESIEHDVTKSPLMVGLTRELAARSPGSWAGSLFHCEPPRFGFSRSQQKLLQSAIAGATDDELISELCVSPSAVKMAWNAIYERASSLFPNSAGNGDEDGGLQARGKQKRHHLLAYLREHPEELRPFSRKLLRNSPPSDVARNHLETA
jgi:hypothetical protein